jgi:hypothetical protein
MHMMRWLRQLLPKQRVSVQSARLEDLPRTAFAEKKLRTLNQVAYEQMLAIPPRMSKSRGQIRCCSVETLPGERFARVVAWEAVNGDHRVPPTYSTVDGEWRPSDYDWFIEADAIQAVQPSPYALPPSIAGALDELPEVAMGYRPFVAHLRNGSSISMSVGLESNYIDWPDGVQTSDIVSVRRWTDADAAPKSAAQSNDIRCLVFLRPGPELS